MTLQERLREFEGSDELNAEAADRIDALIAERDEYKQCADDQAMAHKIERDALMLQIDKHKQVMQIVFDALHYQPQPTSALFAAHDLLLPLLKETK